MRTRSVGSVSFPPTPRNASKLTLPILRRGLLLLRLTPPNTNSRWPDTREVRSGRARRPSFPSLLDPAKFTR
eukprot:scaffold996_cov409-Prasinococcus_capsulatus_cf.AAC.4